MPTYDYKCEKCNKVQENFHGMNETPTIICEKCEAIMYRQIGRGSGVHFKGTGFHCNDYPKGGRE